LHWRDHKVLSANFQSVADSQTKNLRLIAAGREKNGCAKSLKEPEKKGSGVVQQFNCQRRMPR